MIRNVVLVLLGALLGAAAGYGQQPSAKDAILITAVTPSSFADGQEVSVAVTVVYELTSYEEAAIELSSNGSRANAYSPFARTRVKKGSGTTTITGKLVPRYWTANSPAKITVHLFGSDDPYVRSRPVATDNTRIAVAPRVHPETAEKNPNPSVVYDDNVTIKSISPETLVEGQETEVVVTVAYELLSREEGEINLGYNMGRGSGYRIVGSTQVKIGSGEAIVRARLVPIRTGNLPFAKLFVNLSEYPHRPKWAPLANDSETIEIRGNR